MRIVYAWRISLLFYYNVYRDCATKIMLLSKLKIDMAKHCVGLPDSLHRQHILCTHGAKKKKKNLCQPDNWSNDGFKLWAYAVVCHYLLFYFGVRKSIIYQQDATKAIVSCRIESCGRSSIALHVTVACHLLLLLKGLWGRMTGTTMFWWREPLLEYATLNKKM